MIHNGTIQNIKKLNLDNPTSTEDYERIMDQMGIPFVERC